MQKLFFRDYVLNKLMIKGNIKKAIILSSVLFCIIHFVSFINALIMGFCLELIYSKYRNLFLTMIVHSLYYGILILYKFLIYKSVFTIIKQIDPFLLKKTVLLVIVSIIWIIIFIRRNSNIFNKNKVMDNALFIALLLFKKRF